ncbi:helix-turn-helix domain-containing protein [Vreelandella titanicae]|uniref:helix-turn-helix domain-containing protein n=1 Tax=Vreelandella titanicae TaxID=664683 RepID=UPI004043C65E
MQFTITEAANLYGKQRKTLYRHIESGRLSAGVRGDGKRVIDLAELIRCYGETPNTPAASDTELTRDAPQGDTLMTRALLDEMRKQTAVIERMSERIEQLEQALLRLPAPAEPPPAQTASAPIEPAQSTPPQAPATANNPPRDFSDLLARFENRTRH